MDKIAASVGTAVAGFERAKAVLGGINDDLILWERASEYWQKRTFDLRVNEITHLRNLGRISATEEAELWHTLADAQKYGWRNAQEAQENYYKCLYENAKKAIDEQVALGQLSAREIADAWNEVYQSFDNVNIKYQAALQIREALLGGADEQIALRRRDSDRWMSRQTLYGADEAQEVDAYSRRIAAEQQLLREIESGVLNGVTLGEQERETRWREVYEYIEDLEDARYQSAKQYLTRYAADYAAASRDALDETYQYRLDLYNEELAALRGKYDLRRSAAKEERRGEELDELLTQSRYYKDAVTKAGQDKYRDITAKIRDIYDEQRAERDKRRYEEDERAIKDKIARLREEYQNEKDALERSGGDLARLAGQAALQGIAAAASAGDKIQGVMLDVNRAFAEQIQRLFQKTDLYMGEQAAKIARVFDSLGTYSANAAGGVAARESDTNVNVVLNDYGDKRLSDGNAVLSYAGEFLSAVKNALRSQGVR
jgi:hypothetical protein